MLTELKASRRVAKEWNALHFCIFRANIMTQDIADISRAHLDIALRKDLHLYVGRPEHALVVVELAQRQVEDDTQLLAALLLARPDLLLEVGILPFSDDEARDEPVTDSKLGSHLALSQFVDFDGVNDLHHLICRQFVPLLGLAARPFAELQVVESGA